MLNNEYIKQVYDEINKEHESLDMNIDKNKIKVLFDDFFLFEEDFINEIKQNLILEKNNSFINKIQKYLSYIGWWMFISVFFTYLWYIFFTLISYNQNFLNLKTKLLEMSSFYLVLKIFIIPFCLFFIYKSLIKIEIWLIKDVFIIKKFRNNIIDRETLKERFEKYIANKNLSDNDIILINTIIKDKNIELFSYEFKKDYNIWYLLYIIFIFFIIITLPLYLNVELNKCLENVDTCILTK